MWVVVVAGEVWWGVFLGGYVLDCVFVRGCAATGVGGCAAVKVPGYIMGKNTQIGQIGHQGKVCKGAMSIRSSHDY